MNIIEILILILLGFGLIALISTSSSTLKIINAISVVLLACMFVHIQTNANFTSFVFGNFPNSIGIEHFIDTTSYILISLLIPIGTYTLYSLTQEQHSGDVIKYFTLFTTVAICSSIVVIITNDIFNFYVFLELLTICIYLIFSNTTDIQKKKNTLEYLLLGGTSSIFIVLAIEIVYIIYGSLNVAVIFNKSLVIEKNQFILLKISIIFLVVASFIKLAIFPLTSWVRKIYTACPNFFLPFYGSIIGSGISLYMVIFFLYKVIHSYQLLLFASNIITPFCIAGILIFSLMSIKEKDLRVLLGYSTLAQVGYIYICITTPNINAITGGVLHIIHNIIVKFGMFVILTQIYNTHKTYLLESINGLGQNIFIGIAFCIFSASLIGIPGTSGFISKFYMFQGLIEEKRFVVLLAFIAGSVLNIVYLWRVISPMYFLPVSSKTKFTKTSIVVIIITMASTILFGIFTNFTLAKSQKIATEFLQSL
jgi:formate hydrogenlyase subunit 3/multisubunit Na+/H+ antiporter MnhD subunit